MIMHVGRIENKIFHDFTQNLHIFFVNFIKNEIDT